MFTSSLKEVKLLAKQYNTISIFCDFSADNQTLIHLCHVRRNRKYLHSDKALAVINAIKEAAQ